MHLTLSPQQGLPGQAEMTIHIAEDVITLDGIPHDLSAVPEGGEGWPEGDIPFLGPIARHGGVLHCAIIARLGDDAAPNQYGPWVIKHASGDTIIPAARITQEDAE